MKKYDSGKQAVDKRLKPKSSLRWFLCALVFTPIGLAAVFYINFQGVLSRTQELAFSECKRQSAETTNRFNEQIGRAREILEEGVRCAEKLVAGRSSKEQVFKEFNRLDRHYRKITDLNFTAIYGYVNNCFVDSVPWIPPAGYQVKKRPWYVEAHAGRGKVGLVPPYIDADSGKIIVSLSTLLSDNESVMGIDLFFSDMLERETSGCMSDYRRFYLLEKNRNIITDDLNESPASYDLAMKLKVFANDVENGIMRDATVQIDGEPHTLIYHALTSGWVAVSVIDHDALRQAVLLSLKNHFFIGVGITTVVWIFLISCFYRLQRARRLAEEAEQSRTLFFSSVSHDIRTPLNSIIGFSQLLKDDSLPRSKSKEYLDDVINSGNLLLGLINDILDLSKLDANKLEYHYEWTDFKKLGADTLSSFELLSGSSGNKLVDSISQDIPALKIDFHRIRQILFNLIGNAVKFTSDGVIELKAKFEKDDAGFGTLTFVVRDSGIGISKDHIKKILDPFVQVNNTSNGTGLGLSICMRLISQMNGEMFIESELGRGSSFIVNIRKVPYSEEAAVENVEGGKVAVCADGAVDAVRGKKLLLVDDVALNLKVLSRMLTDSFKVNCITASSGMEALELIAKDTTIDLVLTDMQMPGMNGEELLHEIRKNPAWNGIKVCTVSADVNLLNSWKGMGFSGLLLKPITMGSLSKFINDITGTMA